MITQRLPSCRHDTTARQDSGLFGIALTLPSVCVLTTCSTALSTAFESTRSSVLLCSPAHSVVPAAPPRAMSYARAPPGAGGAAPGDYNFLRSSEAKDSKGGWPQSSAAASGEGPKELTETDVQFLGRMEGDTMNRRRTQYINELSEQRPASCRTASCRERYVALPLRAAALRPDGVGRVRLTRVRRREAPALQAAHAGAAQTQVQDRLARRRPDH